MQRQASQGWEEPQAAVREWDPGIQDFRGGAVSAGDKAQGVATGVGSSKDSRKRSLENVAQMQGGQVLSTGALSLSFLGWRETIDECQIAESTPNRASD